MTALVATLKAMVMRATCQLTVCMQGIQTVVKSLISMKIQISMVKICIVSSMSFKLRYYVLKFQSAQPLKMAFSLQRLTWASPKGPGSLFDDDDNVSIAPRKSQSGGKHHRPTSSALLAESESDSNNTKQISAISGPHQTMPESPSQGKRRIRSEPPKSRRQKAYDSEVCKCIPVT